MSIERPSTHDFPAEAEGMDLVYCRPETLTDLPFHYCPGCSHSVVHRVLMEVVDELNIQDKTIGVAPVGCSVFAYHYMNVDMQEAAHGRATAVAAPGPAARRGARSPADGPRRPSPRPRRTRTSTRRAIARPCAA